MASSVSVTTALSAARKKSGLAAARAALEVPLPPPALIESVVDFLRRVAHLEHERCPHCGDVRWRVVATILPTRRTPPLRGPP